MNLHYMNGKPIDTDDEVEGQEDVLSKIESTLGALSSNGNGNNGQEQVKVPAVEEDDVEDDAEE